MYGKPDGRAQNFVIGDRFISNDPRDCSLENKYAYAYYATYLLVVTVSNFFSLFHFFVCLAYLDVFQVVNETSIVRLPSSNNFAIIWTNALPQTVLGEQAHWQLQSRVLISHAYLSYYAIEPFLPSIHSYNLDSTAFPPVRSLSFLPNNIEYE
jgi:hypothetical protein